MYDEEEFEIVESVFVEGDDEWKGDSPADNDWVLVEF